MPSSNLQLPHLVSFCASFELNTNRHCRAVTIASKKWAAQSPYLDHDDRQALAGLRPALLASLCYPTCDFTQLQFITEVVIVMVHWLDKPKVAGDDRFIEQYVLLHVASTHLHQLLGDRHRIVQCLLSVPRIGVL